MKIQSKLILHKVLKKKKMTKSGIEAISATSRNKNAVSRSQLTKLLLNFAIYDELVVVLS